MRLGNVVAAELSKLRTLPAAVLTATGTVLAAAAIAAALAASAADHQVIVSPLDVTRQTVPFVQAGLVLMGILPAAHEHTGRQLRTTLAAVPNRVLLVAGKTAAAILVVVITAAASIGAGFAAATVTQHLVPAQALSGGDGVPWPLAGAVAYLVLIGLLSHAVALLVRHLVPALVGMLSLVLIVSPVLAGVTEHARWLPDRAATQLYNNADTVLTTTTGSLVALAWITLTGGVAIAQFIRRDP